MAEETLKSLREKVAKLEADLERRRKYGLMWRLGAIVGWTFIGAVALYVIF